MCVFAPNAELGWREQFHCGGLKRKHRKRNFFTGHEARVGDRTKSQFPLQGLSASEWVIRNNNSKTKWFLICD